jgi:hypothetical protein
MIYFPFAPASHRVPDFVRLPFQFKFRIFRRLIAIAGRFKKFEPNAVCRSPDQRCSLVMDFLSYLGRSIYIFHSLATIPVPRFQQMQPAKGPLDIAPRRFQAVPGLNMTAICRTPLDKPRFAVKSTAHIASIGQFSAKRRRCSVLKADFRSFMPAIKASWSRHIRIC